MKKCVNCEHLNEDDQVRCDKCGCTISTKEEIPNKKFSKVCPKCEHVVAVKLENCPYCGHRFYKENFLGLTDAEAMCLRLGFGRGR